MNQDGLEALHIGNKNMLSTSMTKKMLNAIILSPSINSLRSLDLSYCNWDAKTNCRKLKALISFAPVLKSISIAH